MDIPPACDIQVQNMSVCNFEVLCHKKARHSCTEFFFPIKIHVCKNTHFNQLTVVSVWWFIIIHNEQNQLGGLTFETTQNRRLCFHRYHLLRRLHWSPFDWIHVSGNNSVIIQLLLHNITSRRQLQYLYLISILHCFLSKAIEYMQLNKTKTN